MVSEMAAKVNFITPIESLLPSVEARMKGITEDYHDELQVVLHHILNSGGKRIRPVVNLLVGRMLGAEEEKLITSAAAIEMLHTATLVHDDLIDGALLRRGSPTINASWTPAQTVLTGDLIFSFAAVLAAETDSVDVMHLFATTLATIVNGELAQQFAAKGSANRSHYYERIHAKTASLFEAAAASAAHLSPVSREEVEIIRRYGYEIGMAFQIVDDILDFTGEQENIGKPIGSDLRQGLVTLPALYYIEAHPEDSLIEQSINGGGQNNEHIDQLVKKINASDAIQRSLEEADGYIQRGIASLQGFPSGVEKEALVTLAEYVVKRNL